MRLKEKLAMPIGIVLGAIIIGVILPQFSNLTEYTVIHMLPIFLLFGVPVEHIKDDRFIFRLQFLVYVMHGICMPYLRAIAKHVMFILTEYCFLIDLGNKCIVLVSIFCIAGMVYDLLNKVAPTLLSIISGGRK